jgi:hypothetical protein
MTKRIVTGQNPASATLSAEEVVKLLKINFNKILLGVVIGSLCSLIENYHVLGMPLHEIE